MKEGREEYGENQTKIIFTKIAYSHKFIKF